MPGSTDATAAAEDIASASNAAATAAAAVGSPVQVAASALKGVREQLDALLLLVGELLGASGVLQEEADLASTSRAIRELLPKQGEMDADEKQVAASALAAVVDGWGGARLLRLVLALQPSHRKLLVEAVQQVQRLCGEQCFERIGSCSLWIHVVPSPQAC